MYPNNEKRVMKMLISELIKRGLTCPNCGGIKIRAGYHDFQIRDSFICETCGLHWIEDGNISPEEGYRGVDYEEQRFIWIMSDTKKPLIPILCEETADEIERRTFVSRGTKWARKTGASQ